MRSTTYGKGLRGKATKLHSQVTRARGVCVQCGQTEPTQLQTAHIIGRRYAATRTDEANSFCACARCHMRWTDHPDEWVAFCDATIGRAEYDRLKAKALAGVRTSESFWRAECERLAELLKQVTA